MCRPSGTRENQGANLPLSSDWSTIRLPMRSVVLGPISGDEPIKGRSCPFPDANPWEVSFGGSLTRTGG